VPFFAQKVPPAFHAYSITNSPCINTKNTDKLVKLTRGQSINLVLRPTRIPAKMQHGMDEREQKDDVSGHSGPSFKNDWCNFDDCRRKLSRCKFADTLPRPGAGWLAHGIPKD
jgi:hypothetical protein